MAQAVELTSGKAVDMRSGAAARLDSGGEWVFMSGAPVQLWSGEYLRLSGENAAIVGEFPPTFNGIFYDQGSSVLNLFCTVSRESIVRFRAKRLDNEWNEIGDYVYTGWESDPPAGKNSGQFTGLLHSTWYRVYIQINATVDPDLSWTLFSAGDEGPDYQTLGRGEANPPYDPGGYD